VRACLDAVTVPASGGSFRVDVSGTSQLAGSCGATNLSPERVFRWTPTVSGVAEITTCQGATDYQTVVYLRSANCERGTEVACAVRGCVSGKGSSIRSTVTAGVTYFIIVDGDSGQAGRFRLRVIPP